MEIILANNAGKIPRLRHDSQQPVVSFMKCENGDIKRSTKPQIWVEITKWTVS
jgi:hypothetical protein